MESVHFQIVKRASPELATPPITLSGASAEKILFASVDKVCSLPRSSNTVAFLRTCWFFDRPTAWKRFPTAQRLSGAFTGQSVSRELISARKKISFRFSAVCYTEFCSTLWGEFSRQSESREILGDCKLLQTSDWNPKLTVRKKNLKIFNQRTFTERRLAIAEQILISKID